MSKENNIFGNLIENIFNNDNLQNLTMNIASSYLINCDILYKILQSKPNLTDELITDKINLFKKTYPESIDLINKYLQPYQKMNSDKKQIYKIREFLQSNNCKIALEDPQVKKYLDEVLNSPEFSENFKKLLKNLNK